MLRESPGVFVEELYEEGLLGHTLGECDVLDFERVEFEDEGSSVDSVGPGIVDPSIFIIFLVFGGVKLDDLVFCTNEREPSAF